MADTRTPGSGAALPDVLAPEVADRLRAAAVEFAAAEAQRLLVELGRALGRAAGVLNAVTEGRSPGFARLALETGRRTAAGKGPVRSVVGAGADRIKDRAAERAKGLLEKGEGGPGPLVVLEQVDVGVPADDAYREWTRLQDDGFSRSGGRVTTTERTPGRRVAWRTEGAGGGTRGVATFHALTEDLTRVVLLMECRPRGLRERAGTLWHAQERRARLDLRHYARRLTMEDASEEASAVESAKAGERR
ncbi:hypothetical protein FM076_06185 [Streptomyces albus subsp. chlorinus]|uniref:hypothetical protein n=1 Tax=Streptomyces albus TaxID=1888 RepID=UPI00156F3E52|nr:hypothetical protein [Streptomyces albus]NSC20814.1 hypothetical protein [Streptomyces albus subsp. chlorinus]